MKPLILTWVLMCGADAATTSAILNGGGREMVLPTQNPWVASAIIGGQATVGAITLSKLAIRHPKLARWVGWTIVGIRATAVVYNSNQLSK